MKEATASDHSRLPVVVPMENVIKLLRDDTY
jgi:hypothetical protein